MFRMSVTVDEQPVVIIGGGPAGLAAAVECGKRGIPAVCLEATDAVGGISRTVEHNGYRFDLGGHRFFTKSDAVNALWEETLGEDFLRRPRQSRIYYRGRFFSYPIRAMDAFAGLGPVESARILLSYAWRRALPHRNTDNFETWTQNLFGDRLYHHFFKAYTEKVWGIPCSRIASEWGAQRIKGLSLVSAIRSAIWKPTHGSIKTLIEEFHYPRLGPGQMYNAMAARAEGLGVPVLRNHRVVRVEREAGRVTSVVAETASGTERFPARHVISTMPFTELAQVLAPGLSEGARAAADRLAYRSLLTVNLMLKQAETIPDTWIYIHEPSLEMGRIQCFRNWSPAMVPDPATSSLGCEYFVTENEGLWTRPDAELIDLARRELGRLGLADPETVFDAFVVRVPKAYPVFDVDYAPRVARLRAEIDPIRNLQPVGRYGMYRYNNMDHSILTGLLAVRNLEGAQHDIWEINTEEEYHEEVRAPEPAPAAT
jgi:protoporphyrinogen oxidase